MKDMKRFKFMIGIGIVILIGLICSIWMGIMRTPKEDTKLDTENALDILTDRELADMSAAVTIIKYGHGYNTEHPIHLMALELAKEVAEKTDGNIIIDVYPDNLLGDEAELLKGLVLGTVEMGSVQAANLSILIPEFQVFTIPYLFEDYEHVDKALYENDLITYFEDATRGSGISILNWTELGFRHFINTERNVYLPTDLEYLALGIPDWAAFQDFCEMFAGDVVTLPESERNDAYNVGIINGQDGTLSTFVLDSIPEEMIHLTLDSHIYATDCMVISESIWTKLTFDERKILLTAIADISEMESQYFREQEEEYIEILTDRGINITKIANNIFWKDAGQEVLEEYTTLLDAYSMKVIEDSRP